MVRPLPRSIRSMAIGGWRGPIKASRNSMSGQPHKPHTTTPARAASEHGNGDRIRFFAAAVRTGHAPHRSLADGDKCPSSRVVRMTISIAANATLPARAVLRPVAANNRAGSSTRRDCGRARARHRLGRVAIQRARAGSLPANQPIFHDPRRIDPRRLPTLHASQAACEASEQSFL